METQHLGSPLSPDPLPARGAQPCQGLLPLSLKLQPVWAGGQGAQTAVAAKSEAVESKRWTPEMKHREKTSVGPVPEEEEKGALGRRAPCCARVPHRQRGAAHV